MKQARLTLGVLLLFVGTLIPAARADYAVKDGTGAPLIIKSGAIAGAILPWYLAVDATGAAFGVTGNPFFVSPASGATFPVSAVAWPLPTGAATASNQAAANTSLASVDNKTPGLVSNASSGLGTQSNNVPGIAYLYAFNGSAWDQVQLDTSKFIKVNCAAGCTGAADTTVGFSGMTVNNAATQIPLVGTNSVGVQVSGTWTATLTPEVSADGGTTWVATQFWNPTTHAASATISSNGTFEIIGTGGMSHARVRISAFTSGTVTGALKAVAQAPSANDAQIQLNTIAALPPALGSATGGWTAKRISALSTTVIGIKASAAGQLGLLHCSNSGASSSFIQIFDVATAGAVTLGTTAPTLSFELIATSSSGYSLPLVGLQFSNGIQIAATSTASGSSAPAAAANCNVGYN